MNADNDRFAPPRASFRDLARPETPLSQIALPLATGEAYRNLRNALSSRDGSRGAFMIGAELQPALEQALDDSSAMRRFGTVQRISNGRTYSVAMTDDTDQEGAIIGENSNTTEVDPVFSGATFDAFTFTSGPVLVPLSVVQDSAIIDGQLGGVLGARTSRRMNRAFTVGNGAGEPWGIVRRAYAVTGSSATSIAIDDAWELVSSVPAEYGRPGRGAFMGGLATFVSLMRIKTGDGASAWKAAGLDQWQFVINKHMPAIGAGNRSLVFGAIDRYRIVDVAEVRVLKILEMPGAIENGLVGFQVYVRSDGALLDEGSYPVAVLEHPAS
jgi:HK97 family phage major capsid protein